jgi:hypothetical protein
MNYSLNPFVYSSLPARINKVMNNSEKTMGKRNTILAISYIKCSQVIEIQVYARISKPRENTLF